MFQYLFLNALCPQMSLTCFYTLARHLDKPNQDLNKIIKVQECAGNIFHP